LQNVAGRAKVFFGSFPAGTGIRGRQGTGGLRSYRDLLRDLRINKRV